MEKTKNLPSTEVLQEQLQKTINKNNLQRKEDIIKDKEEKLAIKKAKQLFKNIQNQPRHKYAQREIGKALLRNLPTASNVRVLFT